MRWSIGKPDVFKKPICFCAKLALDWLAEFGCGYINHRSLKHKLTVIIISQLEELKAHCTL